MIDKWEKTIVENRPGNSFDLIKIAFGLVFFVVLVSHDSFDPTPLNLLWPADGVKNWLSLPGALASGLLFDILGLSAFMVPAFLIFLKLKDETAKWRACVRYLLTVFLFNTLFSLLFIEGSHLLNPYVGFWGYLSNIHLMAFPGRWLSLLVILGSLIRFFRFYRIDPLLFMVLLQLSIFVFAFFQNFSSIVITYGRQFWRYVSVVCLASVGPGISNISKAATHKVHNGFLNIGNGFFRIGLVQKLAEYRSMFSQYRRNRLKPNIVQENFEDPARWQAACNVHNILLQGLREYERQTDPQVTASPIIKV